ncbi:MAG TPA: hypothetical protein VIL95_06190, partial [Bacillota bacterium]
PLGDAAAEQLVDDASLIAGFLEAAMEVRLGNSYFRPILVNLLERLETPFASTRQVFEAVRDAAESDFDLSDRTDR